MPVIEGRDQEAFPILTWDEYMQGAGGVSDGSSQVVIALTNGSVITGECVWYTCTRKDAEALRPAVDMNLICMTIPEKPNSRNQSYLKNKFYKLLKQT